MLVTMRGEAVTDGDNGSREGGLRLRDRRCRRGLLFTAAEQKSHCNNQGG